MSAPAIRSEAELWALLHAMESEAAERYANLAEQMEMHNNPSTAALFRRLAEIESRHADDVLARATGAGVAIESAPRPAANALLLEPAPLETAHYLMTPHHALQLALQNEERAAAFFAALERDAADEAVRRLAAAAHEEELRHVAHVRVWLAEHPAPPQGWADDPDPPVYSE